MEAGGGTTPHPSRLRRATFFAHRRVSRFSLPSVVKSGTLPRNRLAVSAAGGASAISPRGRLGNCISQRLALKGKAYTPHPALRATFPSRRRLLHLIRHGFAVPPSPRGEGIYTSSGAARHLPPASDAPRGTSGWRSKHPWGVKEKAFNWEGLRSGRRKKGE